MKASLLGAICLVTAIQFSVGDENTETLVTRWLTDRNTFDPSSVNDEKRTLVVEELRKRDAPGNLQTREVVRRYLIELGDRETADMLIAELRKGNRPGPDYPSALSTLQD